MKNLKSIKGNARAGFTLVELVVIIGILGILAVMLIPSLIGMIERGQQTRRMNTARTIFVSTQNDLALANIENALRTRIAGYNFLPNSDNLDTDANNIVMHKLDGIEGGAPTLNGCLKNGCGEPDCMVGGIPDGFFPAEDTDNWRYVRYISIPRINPETRLRERALTLEEEDFLNLLDEIIEDRAILNNALLMEYNIRTGVIMSVFFGNDGRLGQREFFYTEDDGRAVLGVVDGAPDDIRDSEIIYGPRGTDGYRDLAQERRQGFYGVRDTGTPTEFADVEIFRVEIYDGANAGLKIPGVGNNVQRNLLYAVFTLKQDDDDMPEYNFALIDANTLSEIHSIDIAAGELNITPTPALPALSAFNPTAAERIYYDDSGDCASGLCKSDMPCPFTYYPLGNPGDPCGCASGSCPAEAIVPCTCDYEKYIWVIDYIGDTVVNYTQITGSRPRSIRARATRTGGAPVTSSSVAHTHFSRVLEENPCVPGVECVTGTPCTPGVFCRPGSYEVRSARHLNNIRYTLEHAHTFRQTADICMGGSDDCCGPSPSVCPYNIIPEFIPIGHPGGDPTYGVFSGGYHGMRDAGSNFEIKNMTLPAQMNAGLFTVNEGVIQGLTFRNASVDTTQNGGGAAAGTNKGEISRVFVYESEISGSGLGNAVGGVAGRNYPGAIVKDSLTHGSVITGQNAGGIMGDNGGYVLSCGVEQTDVAGSGTAGGVVGLNHYGTVRDVYFLSLEIGTAITGNVNRIGGIVGDNSTGSVSYALFFAHAPAVPSADPPPPPAISAFSIFPIVGFGNEARASYFLTGEESSHNQGISWSKTNPFNHSLDANIALIVQGGGKGLVTDFFETDWIHQRSLTAPLVPCPDCPPDDAPCLAGFLCLNAPHVFTNWWRDTKVYHPNVKSYPYPTLKSLPTPTKWVEGSLPTEGDAIHRGDPASWYMPEWTAAPGWTTPPAWSPTPGWQPVEGWVLPVGWSLPAGWEPGHPVPPNPPIPYQQMTQTEWENRPADWVVPPWVSPELRTPPDTTWTPFYANTWAVEDRERPTSVGFVNGDFNMLLRDPHNNAWNQDFFNRTDNGGMGWISSFPNIHADNAPITTPWRAGTTSYWIYYEQTFVRGWNTRPVIRRGYDNNHWRAIEFQRPRPHAAGTRQALVSYDGRFNTVYAELNADVRGTLHQFASTKPGQELFYSFYHLTGTHINPVSATNIITDKMNFYLTKTEDLWRPPNYVDNELSLIRPCWSPRSKPMNAGTDAQRIARVGLANARNFLWWNPVASYSVAYGTGTLQERLCDDGCVRRVNNTHVTTCPRRASEHTITCPARDNALETCMNNCPRLATLCNAACHHRVGTTVAHLAQCLNRPVASGGQGTSPLIRFNDMLREYWEGEPEFSAVADWDASTIYIYDVWISPSNATSDNPFTNAAATSQTLARNGNGYGITFWSHVNLGLSNEGGAGSNTVIPLNGITQAQFNTGTWNWLNDARNNIFGYWGVEFGWKHFYGKYTVPAGQETTEFAYQSNSGSADQGNFLAGVSFRTPSFLTLDQRIVYQGSEEEAKFVTPVYPQNNLTIELTARNWGEMPARNIVIEDQLFPYNRLLDYTGGLTVTRNQLDTGGNIISSTSIPIGANPLTQAQLTLTPTGGGTNVGMLRVEVPGVLNENQSITVRFNVQVRPQIRYETDKTTMMLSFLNQGTATYGDAFAEVNFNAFLTAFPQPPKPVAGSNIEEVYISPIRLSKTVRTLSYCVATCPPHCEHAGDPLIDGPFRVTLSVSNRTDDVSPGRTEGIITEVIPNGFNITSRIQRSTDGVNWSTVIFTRTPNPDGSSRISIRDVNVPRGGDVYYRFDLEYVGTRPSKWQWGYGVTFISQAEYRYAVISTLPSPAPERTIMSRFPSPVVGLSIHTQPDDFTTDEVVTGLNILGNDNVGTIVNKLEAGGYSADFTVILTDEFGIPANQDGTNNYFILQPGQWQVVLNRFENDTIEFEPIFPGTFTATFYYQVLLTATSPRSSRVFVLDSEITEVNIFYSSTDTLVYFEQYEDGEFGIMSADGVHPTAPPLRPSDTIINTGYGVLSGSNDRTILINGGTDTGFSQETATVAGLNLHRIIDPVGNLLTDSAGLLTVSLPGGIDLGKIHPNFAEAAFPMAVTSVDTFIIRTPRQMRNIGLLGDTTGLTFNQARSLDFAGINLNADGAVVTGEFKGTYSGQGITNVTINSPLLDNVGLFSENSGTISNITLSHSDITGNNNVGAIAGNNTGTLTGNTYTDNVTVTSAP
jgi:hypothetical protein